MTAHVIEPSQGGECSLCEHCLSFRPSGFTQRKNFQPKVEDEVAKRRRGVGKAQLGCYRTRPNILRVVWAQEKKGSQPKLEVGPTEDPILTLIFLNHVNSLFTTSIFARASMPGRCF